MVRWRPLKGPLNPVLARELRQRMRGRRAMLVISAYLLLLSLVVQAMYSVMSRASRNSIDAEDVARLGRSLFQTLLFFVLLLVCFIVPGLTAGAVTGERERQTLVPLQVTPLGPGTILIGKLFASVAFVVLLIVATLPLAGVSFILGGVEPGEVVRSTAMVVVSALMLACVALACSAVLRTTQGATVVAYALVGLLCAGTLLAFGTIVAVSDERDVGKGPWLLLAPNPFLAVSDVLDRGDREFEDSAGSPFTPMESLLGERTDRDDEEISEGGVVITPDGERVLPTAPLRRSQPPPEESGLERVPFWVLSLGAYAVLGLASLLLARRRLWVPRARLQ